MLQKKVEVQIATIRGVTKVVWPKPTVGKPNWGRH